jgi:hypothetical protein
MRDRVGRVALVTFENGKWFEAARHEPTALARASALPKLRKLP